MGALYQKPGSQSSEWKLVLASLVGVLVGVPFGGLVMAKWHFWAGAGLLVAFPVVATVWGAAYITSRGRVKSAAEQMKPPPSRVL